MIELSTVQTVAPALRRGELSGAYNRVRPAYRRDTALRVNLGKRADYDVSPAPARAASNPAPVRSEPAIQRPKALRAPELLRPALRGQKAPLGVRQGEAVRLRVGLGWNVNNARCDVDVSAFLLGENGRVPGDDWFVFYGQDVSPDGSVRFFADGGADREAITVDFSRLSPSVMRIALVMTIDEAAERRVDFSAIDEAWLRVLDDAGRERVSYRPEGFFSGITSMTLGEIYLRNGEWRFNPVGNGMRVDLAGQCAAYGVNAQG